MKNRKQYFAMTPFQNYIKIEGAHTQKEALSILQDENFTRPEWGVKCLAYHIEGSRDGMTICFNTEKMIPARVQQ